MAPHAKVFTPPVIMPTKAATWQLPPERQKLLHVYLSHCLPSPARVWNGGVKLSAHGFFGTVQEMAIATEPPRKWGVVKCSG